MLTITAPTWRGLCAQPAVTQNPVSPGVTWDLDAGDLLSWTRALQLCDVCPFKARCAAERDATYRSRRPAGVIWAGVAYSDAGTVLDAAGLRRLAAARRGLRRRDARRGAAA